MTEAQAIPTSDVGYVKELYPRLKPDDAAIERYRDAIENLPPIVVARGRVLVDGYHRWQAHRREGIETIPAIDLGDLTDTEIFNESIRRNAAHGQQLSQADKRNLAGKLWQTLGHLPSTDRQAEIAELLAVAERTIQAWTKDARKAEKEQVQAKAWDLWLDCMTLAEIAEATAGDADKTSTVDEWISGKRKAAEFGNPPESRQHFDVWSFTKADKTAGSQSYFGAIPPQVVENLLWFYTDPGDIVVDLFAGSGTTIDVAKTMGRRVWASDIRGDRYSPHLPIRQHDATGGWPAAAPAKAKLVLLDPPYWQQAQGRYSSEPNELAEMDYDTFLASWAKIVQSCRSHLADDGKVAFIISPTQREDGVVVDHAFDMARVAADTGYEVERRIIVTYQTQQATGQQVEWARAGKRMLKLYRDLVVLR